MKGIVVSLVLLAMLAGAAVLGGAMLLGETSQESQDPEWLSPSDGLHIKQTGSSIDKVIMNKTMKEEFDVEITNSSFTLNRFNKETYLKVNLGEGEVRYENGKLSLERAGLNTSLYRIEGTDEFKFDIILDKPPKENSFSFPIDSVNLSYYYQPPLNASGEENCNETHCWDNESRITTHRPENTVGSYAVYYNKMNNEYKAGKAFHIYRPLVYDAKNNSIWGELNISNGIMTVSVDSDWLTNAEYPVVIDPGFGYSGLAEISTLFALGLGMGGASDMWGNAYNLPEEGTLDKISVVLATYDAGSIDVFVAIYREDSAGSGSHDLVVGIERAGLDLPSTAGWVDFTASSESLSADDYILAVLADWEDLEDEYEYVEIFYDEIESTVYYEGTAGEGAYATRKAEDPWTATAEVGNYKYSIYANYTVAGDTTPPDISFITPTPNNDTNLSQDNYFVNVSISESADTVFLELTNTSGTINYTMTNEAGDWWNFNVTGQGNTMTYFFVYANDTAGNLNRSLERFVNISVSAVDNTTFNMTLPLQTPVQSSLAGPSTQPIEINFSAKTEAGINASVVSGVPQNNTYAIFEFKNVGNVNLKWIIELNESTPSCIKLNGSWDSAGSSVFNLNATTNATVNTSIAANEVEKVWVFGDALDCTVNDNAAVTITHYSQKA